MYERSCHHKKQVRFQTYWIVVQGKRILRLVSSFKKKKKCITWNKCVRDDMIPHIYLESHFFRVVSRARVYVVIFFFWDFQLDYDASSPGVSVLNYALRKHELRVRCKRIMCSAKLWFLDTLCKNKSCVLNILLCVTLNYFSTLYNKQKRTPYTQLIFWQSVLWTHVLNTHGVVLGKVLRALATVFCV